MIPKKYESWLGKTIRKYFPENKVFIFGSSLKCNRFRDIDVGILGNVDDKKLQTLNEELEKSVFPFFVDLIDFNKVGETFYNSVILDQSKKWI